MSTFRPVLVDASQYRYYGILAKRQAAILFGGSHPEIVQGSTLCDRQRNKDQHVVNGENTFDAVQFAVKPVRVQAFAQMDEITFFEADVTVKVRRLQVFLVACKLKIISILTLDLWTHNQTEPEPAVQFRSEPTDVLLPLLLK